MSTTITSQQLHDIADAMEIKESSIRANYSGRGMYGRTCVGFDLDTTGELFILGACAWQVLGIEATEWGSPSTDGMGRGIIAYFQGLELAEGEAWEPNDEDW